MQSFFFHQWLIKLANKYKLTVIFHCENEQWNVVVIKYRNSSIYVQRQIDKILRKYRHFAKTYVDDIIVFFNFLEKHLKHLNLIFVLFKKYNIVIKLFKTYLNYSILFLLEQRVDNLDLITIEKKIETIRDFKFSRTLKNLKTYFEKTKYFRQYIAYYVQKVKFFQQKKICLLRDASSKKRTRKQYF